MRWRGRRESANIEDRRGMRVGRTAGIGGVGLVAVYLISMYFGVDPAVLLGGVQTSQVGQEPGNSEPYSETATEAERRERIAVVLADTEDVWGAVMADLHGGYRTPKLVLFSGAVDSGCGFAEAAVGPFYCPADERVFIDLSFFDEMEQRLGASGDFAQAYVLAHEVGHHVQKLLGTSGRVQELSQRVDEIEANQMSVRLELQADCYAGLWARHAEQTSAILEPGDIEEALGAASAVGDDRLQRRAGGQVVPDSFTHGTSEQRARWFRNGFDKGTLEACDTFKEAGL
ncbi:MAG: flagellar biosynthesis protein FlgM [Gammaproteobacteria bacterium]|nr:flagellar biosynthesis protein FlgM [Gammaproteobacteria bacterium]